MFKNVMVPIDLQHTEKSQQVIDLAVHHVRQSGGSLHVVTVVPGFGMPVVGSFFPKDALKEAKKVVARQLKEYVEGMAPDDIGKIREKVMEGNPAENIVSYAQKNDIDLIVMRSRKQRKMGQGLLGYCASKVVENAKCSVMLVR
jgi:universal stress protein F